MGFSGLAACADRGTEIGDRGIDVGSGGAHPVDLATGVEVLRLREPREHSIEQREAFVRLPALDLVQDPFVPEWRHRLLPCVRPRFAVGHSPRRVAAGPVAGPRARGEWRTWGC